jgi:CelD/BcsL family acetyltransferase involved in cellulose biosynthesis
MSTLQIRIETGMDALPAGPRELWLREERSLQFDQTLLWSELLARHALECDETVRIVSAYRDSGECVGVLPLKTTAPEGPWRLRTVRALANYYCSLFSPIVESKSERAPVLRALLDAARQLQPDALDLNPLADAPDAAEIQAMLEELGWRAERYFRFGNWYLEVAGRSFAEYFAALPSQLRNTVTRKEKKLRQQPGFSIAIAQTPEEADAALAGYQRIYAASWKNPEPHPHFVPSLVRRLAERGWLRMGLVQLGEEPVAAQIWSCKDRVVSIFKLAYDERFAQWSAGSVLTTHLMRHVLDVDRAAVVDYLTGDDAYKRDWMSHRRERVGVRALRTQSWRARGELLSNSLVNSLRPARRALAAMRQIIANRRGPPTSPTA